MSLLEDYYDIWNQSTDFAIRMVFLAKRLNSGPTGFLTALKLCLRRKNFRVRTSTLPMHFLTKQSLLLAPWFFPCQPPILNVPSSLWAARKPTSEIEWRPGPLIDNLVRISIEGPIAAEFDFLRAVNNSLTWDREKDESRLNFQSSSHKRSVLL